MMCLHESGKCEGRCATGCIVAIIFGALFIWMLVTGYLTQAAGNGFTAFAYYLVSLVFLTLACMSCHFGMHCGESKGIMAKLTKPLKKR